METTARGWNVLDRERAILWREYSFGPGVATTFVFRGAGDGLIVVSPGVDTDAAALDELSDFGKVVALVATNGYHWLGQRSWRKHFPEARSFSPAQGIARIAKKLPEFGRFEPLAALGTWLGDRAKVVDAPGLKVGNAFATVQGTRGSYFYASDMLSNIAALPSSFVFRTLMTMTDSAPGYRLFRPSIWLQVKDKRAFRGWMEGEIARSSPVAIVPAHGAPVGGGDIVTTTQALLAKL
jgi:hypothetical protein